MYNKQDTYQANILLFLVMENNAYRKLYKDILETENFSVMAYESVSEAINMLEILRPSIILSDSKFPSQYGLKNLKKIKERISNNLLSFVYMNNPEKRNSSTQKTGINVNRDNTETRLIKSLGKIFSTEAA